MPLPDIVFELPASQYERMNVPGLRQGQPLDVIFDGGVLLPDPGAANWFAVQPQPLPAHLIEVARGTYAVSGQIKAAELSKTDGEEAATLLIDCGIPLRVACAPYEDGRLPYGTWETRYLAGILALQGIVEEEFTTAIGQIVSVTIWGFQRLVLTPGDPLFGQWFESDNLQSTQYKYDRVWISARLHKSGAFQV